MQKINELQLAKELMKFPSITPRDAGVMRFLEKKLKKIGFKTKILNFKEKNVQPVKNLYARLGSKGPNFCFAGHLDVVPPGNIKDWTVNPFRPSIKKGHLIGRGANDMKGSVAAFVSAVSIFLNNNKSFNGSISLFISVSTVFAMAELAFLVKLFKRSFIPSSSRKFRCSLTGETYKFFLIAISLRSLKLTCELKSLCPGFSKTPLNLCLFTA